MEDITRWLEDPSSIEEGRQIYNLYAPRYRANDVLSYQINEYSNSITRQLIKEELEAILPLVTIAKRPKERPSMKFHTRGSNKDLPPDLTALDESIPSLYKKRDAYRYRMRDTEPGRDLMMMAFEAVKYDQEIRRIYKILDFYERTGTYPPEMDPKAEQTQIEKMTYWLKALKSYPRWLTRNRNKPEVAEEYTRRTKVIEEINEYLKDADQEE